MYGDICLSVDSYTAPILLSLHNSFDREAIDSLLSWESFAYQAPSRPHSDRVPWQTLNARWLHANGRSAVKPGLPERERDECWQRAPTMLGSPSPHTVSTRPPPPRSPSSPMATIRASRSYRSTSARSTDLPRRFLQPHLAPLASTSSAAAKALSAPETSSRNCPHSRWRLPVERSKSIHGSRHSPMSSKPGPPPPTPTSTLSSPHNPEHAQRTPTPFRALPPCRYPRRMNAVYRYRHLPVRTPIRLSDAVSSEQ